MEREEMNWNRETVPKALRIVSAKLAQKDVVSLLLVSQSIHQTLVSCPSLWLALDFREMNNAGNRLLLALSLKRYEHVKEINLEFAQDIEDKHLVLIKNKCLNSLEDLETLNLNGCQKISDTGVEAITEACPYMKVFSIYWNVRVTDIGVKHLVKNCKHVVDLNLSGCKQISDKSLRSIAEHYLGLEFLNLTRCVKLTDNGLQQILQNCSSLSSLNLYALSSLSDDTYKSISFLPRLTFLDLCGAQNLSDDGLSSTAKCDHLNSLNLTWCVRITDAGIAAIAASCNDLEFLSLFGIVGVTDKCLEALSRSCSHRLTTLDVNGCVGIKKRSREELLQLFPRLTCFKVHS